jgi:hypothetical protein
MQRLGISQKFWDKMLNDGLPYTTVGHTRWVTGQALIEHLSRNAERKTKSRQLISKRGQFHVETARDWKCAAVS